MNNRLNARLLWVLCFLPALLSGGAQASEPWQRWSRNPLTIPVTVSLTNLYAATNGAVLIKLADGSAGQAGAGCDTPTNAPSFVANLQVRREYELTIVSSNFTSFDGIKLTYKPNWTPLGSRGRGGKPKNYQVLVDRALNPTGQIPADYGTNSCGSYTQVWTIELTERLPANWRMEDGSDNPSAGPGDGNWLELGPGRSMDIWRSAFNWSVSLGRLMDGTAAGRLSLRDNRIATNTFAATNLFVLSGSEVARDSIELVTVVPGSLTLRQVKATQSFVDIVELTNTTEMRFYFTNQIGAATNASGHYTNITGNPFVTWIVANPNSSTNKLQIIEKRDALLRTNELIFDPASSTATWTLKYGTGSVERVETRGVVVTSSNRVETVDIKYAGAATPAYKAKETYHLFPWGFELIETRIDPDNNALTSNDLVTSFSFHTTTNSYEEEVNYGRLRTTVYPDGYWELRDYNDDYTPGALTTMFTPHLDDVSNPLLATNSNSVKAVYQYADYTQDFVDIERSYSDDLYGSFRKERRYKGWSGGFDLTFDGAREFTATPWFSGLYSESYDEWWGLGYTGHPTYSMNYKDAEELSYYHGGTLTNNTFTANGGNVWDGPDWRKSTLFSGQRDDWHNPDYVNPVALDFWEAEGEALYPLGGEMAFAYVNESWKETEVFQKGSLSMKEMYVFTNVDAMTFEPQFDLVRKTVILNDSLGRATNITQIDGATGVSRVIYEASYRGATNDTDLLQWEIDEFGVKKTYAYDSLKRPIEVRQEGVSAGGGFSSQGDRWRTISYDAYGRTLQTIISGTGASLTNATVFDIAGRPTSVTDTNAMVTTITYDLGGRKTTRTMPSGRTEIRENYLDRRLKSVTGTGVVHEYHNWRYATGEDFSDDWDGTVHGEDGRGRIRHQIKVGASTSLRVKYETVDWINHTNHVETPDFISTNYVANRFEFFLGGQKYELPQHKYSSVRGMQSFGFSPVESYEYDFAGRLAVLITPLIGLNGMSEVTQTNARVKITPTVFEKISGHWFQTTSNLVCRDFATEVMTPLEIRRERLNGFSSSNTVSQVTTTDADTNDTVVTVTIARSTKTLTEVTDTPQSTLNATNITKNELLVHSSTPSVSAPVRYGYDSLGRQTSVTNSLGFALTTAYDNRGFVASSTDFTGMLTEFIYVGAGTNGAGQVRTKTVAGAQTTHYAYTNSGVWRIWGKAPYPEERLYNELGDFVQLNTYRGGSGWSNADWPSGTTGTADVTKWVYQESSGYLLHKVDNSSKTNSFTYWQGLPLTKTWARGVSTTNEYSDLGELFATKYDSSTPTVLFTNGVLQGFSRTGLPLFTHDGSGDWNLLYDHADRLIASVCATGSFAGITVSNRFDKVYGKNRIYVGGISSPVDTTYGFDSNGRISTVTNGTATVAYGYLSNSDLLSTTTFKNSGTTRLTTTRTWDFGARLRAIKNVAGSSVVSSHSYAYDALNRRTAATLNDNSFWDYDYNDRDEVVGGNRFWQDFSPVSGQQFAYAFDSIGNRTEAKTGGDTNGFNLRTTSYSANGLNEYTSITTPGYKDILGISHATNTVTVNGAPTDRKVEYFHAELTLTNGSNPLWTAVSVVGGGTTNSGGFVHPKNVQTLTYDDDGNLTFDGVWTYQWDAENRLVQMVMTNVSEVTNQQRKKLTFSYDYMNRRSAKCVYYWTNGVFSATAASDLRFVYDGLNLKAEVDSANGIVRAYGWGIDLSGKVNGAGGIGGLLFMSVDSSKFFPSFDGNGNVTALTKDDGSLVASYEFGAFGEPLRVEGAFAKGNPFRFSSKYTDEETGLVYYGYRFYSPVIGRWLGRDPVGEQPLPNLFCFVFNNGLLFIDPDGRLSMKGMLNSTVGIIGNTIGLIGGVVLMSTGGGLVVGGFVTFKAAYGLVANFENMYDAIKNREGRSSGNVFGDVAKLFTDSQNAQKLATAMDLATDLVAARAAASVVTANFMTQYGQKMLEGGARLGKTFGDDPDKAIEAMAGLAAFQAMLDALTDPNSP